MQLGVIRTMNPWSSTIIINTCFGLVKLKLELRACQNIESKINNFLYSMLHGHTYFGQVPVSDMVLVRHFPNPYLMRTRFFFFFLKSGYSVDMVAIHGCDTADLRKKKKSKILTTGQTTHHWSWFEHNYQLKALKDICLSVLPSLAPKPFNTSLCLVLALSMLSESLCRRSATKEPLLATVKLPLSPFVIEWSFSLLQVLRGNLQASIILGENIVS